MENETENKTENEFKRWSSIEKFEQMVTITEKVHGSNAQIYITDTEVRCASRERWLDRVADNFGFCNHVLANEEEVRTLLGPGRHYGEWYGAGINSTYDLKGKRFALFDTRFADPQPRPSWCDVVPILYRGIFSQEAVNEALAKLKKDGSVISPGFMRPEGVVIRFERSGVFMKKVFEAEESAWDGKVRDPAKDAENAARRTLLAELGAKYLQPIRLEKLLSKDEQLTVGYPTTLPQIVKMYCADLEKETDELDPEAWKAAKKNLFQWVRSTVEKTATV